jgi:hypothetical protein
MSKKTAAESHVIAVVKLDNGELVEDVILKEVVEQSADAADRVVDTSEMPETPDRPHPTARIPGTLPRTTPED